MALISPSFLPSICVRTFTVRSDGKSGTGSLSVADFGFTSSFLCAALSCSDGSAISTAPSRSAGLKFMMKKNKSWNVMSSIGVIGRTIFELPSLVLRRIARSSWGGVTLYPLLRLHRRPDLQVLEPRRLAEVHHLEQLVQLQLAVGPEVHHRRHLAALGLLLRV